MIEVFKPIIIVIKSSIKSKASNQIQSFDNISVNDFNLIKLNQLELSRKMNKFEVWNLKQEYENWAMAIIRGENLINLDENKVDTDKTNTDNINLITIHDHNSSSARIELIDTYSDV